MALVLCHGRRSRYAPSLAECLPFPAVCCLVFKGAPPSNAPYKLIYEYIARTLQQYGGYARISAVVDMTEFLDTADVLTTKFGVRADQSEENLILLRLCGQAEA